jgi:cytoskeletal protein RodZ
MVPEEWEPIAARIRAAWPDFAADEATTGAYVSTLADLDARAVGLAVDDLLREPREHAPPPGVIRERVLRLSTAPAGPTAPTDGGHGGRAKTWLAVVVGALAVALIATLVVLGVRRDESPSATATQTTTAVGAVTVAPPSRSVTVTAPERTVTTAQTVTTEQTVTASPTTSTPTTTTSPGP